MSDNLRTFTAAVYGFDAVVNRVPADGWDAPSACEGWTARDLVQHQCAVLNGVAAIAQTGAMAKPAPPEDMSDPAAVWAETRENLLAALDQPGVLSQQGPFWFDAADVDDLIGVVQWDPLAHTWDLAQAHGQPWALDERAAAHSLAWVEASQAMLNESGRTQAAVAVADDASTAEKFLAATGRQPTS